MLHFLTEHFVRLWAFGALVVLLPLVLYGWHRRQITIRHSSLVPHKGMRRRWSVLLIMSYVALGGMTVSADLALMGPRQPAAVVEHIVQERNVCVFGDRSGSMDSVLQDGIKELSDDESKAKGDPKAKVVDNGGSDKLIVASSTAGAPAPSEELVAGKATRVDGMYLAIRFLIRHRMTNNPAETDRFCIMTFDTDTYVMTPLSRSKQVLMLRTVHLKENTGGGTNFFGPARGSSGIGPLQKALDFFGKYTGKDAANVVVIITDGNDSGDPVRMQQLMALYQEAHLRLYIIGLGDGWKKDNNLDLQKFADSLHAADPTNGIVFWAQNPGQMNAAMERINAIEKRQEKIKSVQTYEETPFWYLVSTVFFGLLFVGLSLFVRRIP